MSMTRTQALPYVAWIIDDALNPTRISERAIKPDAVLVGWQCGFQPMFVAVQSYMDGVQIDADDAVDIAVDFLLERNWFMGERVEPDYVLYS